MKATAVEEGTGRNVGDSYSVSFTGIEAELQITNRVTPEEIAVGDVVTIEYVLRNTGKTTMVDIVVEEPEFGEVARFNQLKPGQEETFSIEKLLNKIPVAIPGYMPRTRKPVIATSFMVILSRYLLILLRLILY